MQKKQQKLEDPDVVKTCKVKLYNKMLQIIELDTDGSPKKEADKAKPLQTAVPDHLFKYEVEEVARIVRFGLGLNRKDTD